VSAEQSAAPPLFYLLDFRARGDACLWWGPKRCGYTTSLDGAGKYTKEEAEREQHGHADKLVAVPCELADGLAYRVVSRDHEHAFREQSGACSVRGCRMQRAPGETLCAKCIAGDAGKVHIAGGRYGSREGETWCGQSVAESWRTYEKHERLVQDFRADEATCRMCKFRLRVAKTKHERHHYHGCENPYCEGCREPIPERRRVG